MKILLVLALIFIVASIPAVLFFVVMCAISKRFGRDTGEPDPKQKQLQNMMLFWHVQNMLDDEKK